MSDYVRDRSGEMVPARDHDDPACCCDGTGWAGEDVFGRPIVCLSCRPHLIGQLGPQRHRRHRPRRLVSARLA